MLLYMEANENNPEEELAALRAEAFRTDDPWAEMLEQAAAATSDPVVREALERGARIMRGQVDDV